MRVEHLWVCHLIVMKLEVKGYDYEKLIWFFTYRQYRVSVLERNILKIAFLKICINKRYIQIKRLRMRQRCGVWLMIWEAEASLIYITNFISARVT